MESYIIEHVVGWRVDDYDGYNDFYTNVNNKKGWWNMKKVNRGRKLN